MLELLLSALVISLFCNGIHILFEEGRLFGSIRKINLPELISSPLYDCILCMASIWGTVGFILVYGHDPNLWRGWIITIIICIPLNGFVKGAFERVF